MRECLKCKGDISDKHESAKFCSTSCRVMWNRNPANKKEKGLTELQQMKVLYNALMDKIDKLEFQPSVSQKISVISEPIKKSSWDEPQQTHLVTFQELLNGMADIQFSDDKESYAEKIRKATHLSEKQINLLLTNLWSKQ